MLSVSLVILSYSKNEIVNKCIMYLFVKTVLKITKLTRNVKFSQTSSAHAYMLGLLPLFFLKKTWLILNKQYVYTTTKQTFASIHSCAEYNQNKFKK